MAKFKKVYRILAFAFSIFICLSSSITVMADTQNSVDVQCSHEYVMTYVKTEYGIDAICSSCNGVAYKYIYYEGDCSKITTVDFTEYNGTNTIPCACVEITAETDMTLKVWETVPCRADYMLLENNYNSLVEALLKSNEGDTAPLDKYGETMIFSASSDNYTQTGEMFSFEIDLSADTTYLLLVHREAVSETYGTFKLSNKELYENYIETGEESKLQEEYCSSGDWEYLVLGSRATLKKYIGSDEAVTIPLSIEGTNITSVDEKAFADSYYVRAIILDNFKLTDINFIVYCDNLEKLYYHEGMQLSATPEVANKIGSLYEAGGVERLCIFNYPDGLPKDCSQRHYLHVNCSVCGYDTELYFDTNELNHDFSEFVEHVDTTDSSCAYDLYKCANCQQTKKLNGEHTWTLKYGGNGKWYDEDGVQHTGTYEVYQCSVCREEKYVDHSSHNYEPKGTVSSYTDESGVLHEGLFVCYACICGDKYYEEHNEHTYEITEVDEPTCTEAGYTYYECICGTKYMGNRQEPLGHNSEVLFSYIPDECGVRGHIDYHCFTCGQYYTEWVEPEHMYHDYIGTFVEPTCTAFGYIKCVCENCGLTVQFNEDDAWWGLFEDEAEGNYYTDIINWVIDILENNNLQPQGHCLVSEVIPPTETTKGYTRYYCKDCGIPLGCNENYTPELKWDTLDSYKNVAQDNAIIFKDKNGDYYLMAWNDDDFCNLSYKKNNDGTINFEIFSNTTCENIDWNIWDKIHHEHDDDWDSDEYDYRNPYPGAEDVARDNLSTAFLYKYSSGKWRIVKDEWAEDTRFTKILTKDYYYEELERESDEPALTTESILTNKYVSQSTIEGQEWNFQQDNHMSHQIKIETPQIYGISFEGIKANNIEDAILWFKSAPDNDNDALFFDSDGIRTVPPDDVLEENEHLRTCQICRRMWGLWNYLFSDETIAVFDQTEYTSGEAYHVVVLNQYNPDFEDLYNEYNELINSDEYINNPHYVAEKVTTSLTFWNDNLREHLYSATPSMINEPKPAEVIVNYIDEDGNYLTDSLVITGKGFDEYSTEAKSFENYKLLSLPDNASGKMLKSRTVVNYIYSLIDKTETMQEKVPVHTDKPDNEEKPLTSPYTGADYFELIQISAITLFFFTGIILLLIYRYSKKGA